MIVKSRESTSYDEGLIAALLGISPCHTQASEDVSLMVAHRYTHRTRASSNPAKPRPATARQFTAILNQFLEAMKAAQSGQPPGSGNGELKSVKDACDQFVNDVSAIPGVAEVLLDYPAREEATIWTLISAAPFERKIRDQVYEAQVHILRRLSSPLVAFQVINLRELPDAETVSQVIPKDAVTIWKG